MSRRDDTFGLDELFAGSEGAASGGPARGWVRGRWLLGRVFFSVALATVLSAGLWVVRVGVPYSLLVVTIFVVTVLRAAVARIDARPVPAEVTGRGLGPPQDCDLAIEADHDEGRTPDGMRVAIGRWDSRLNYPGNDPDRVARVILPRLREVADERLRLRHGFTMASDPSRARQAMGEQLWTMIHGQHRDGFTPQAMAVVVERMEAL